MICEECGHEMREETIGLGFVSEWGELPTDKRKQYTCMTEKWPKFNYPQKIEGLT